VPEVLRVAARVDAAAGEDFRHEGRETELVGRERATALRRILDQHGS
jgi:hypothetical protein